MNHAVRLYQAKTSSASWRVRLALAIKGIAYESTWINLYEHEHLSGNYASISPTQQVPSLEIDGYCLMQTTAIIEYLDETRPKPILVPRDPLSRVRVRAMVEIINSNIQPLHNYAVRQRLMEQFNSSEEGVKAWCRYWIEHRFEALNQLVEANSKSYAFGDAVSIVDVFLYPQVKTSNRFDVDVSRLPGIVSVMKKLDSLPHFSKSDVLRSGY